MSSSHSARPAFDAGMLPLGERALQRILDHVIAVGDEAETTFLEVKSTLDLSSKLALAKMAKFLLGAANRRPVEAARHFHGYAVMVIGAQKGVAKGVPRGVEAHEVEDRLQPYLGPHFPAFEFGRLVVDAEREVLFVIAQPPQEGQTIFPCHKDFQGDNRNDSLEDGAIYVRGSSNTRRARSGEVLALVERARGGGKPPIRLELEVLGSVARVDRVDAVLQQLRDYEEEQFRNEPELADDAFAATSIKLASSIFGGMNHLTAEDRARALAGWRARQDEHLSQGREHLLGTGLSGVGIRATSRDRFVAKPHLIVTFHGCELLDHRDLEDADYSKVVEPVVRKAGPLGVPIDFTAMRPLRRDYPVAWHNRGDDAEVVLTPESFRPNVPWTSEQDDYVIVARDPSTTTIEVTWILTEEGNDLPTTGSFEVPTAESVDAAELFGAVFDAVE